MPDHDVFDEASSLLKQAASPDLSLLNLYSGAAERG